MNKKRDRLQIIHDILWAIREKNGRIKPTHVLYKSNLSHQMLDDYMTNLIGNGFIIVKRSKDGKKTYSLTDKGFQYLNKYKVIVDFVDSFGLG
ncbi:hypothetical protein JW826_03750 [Candidatus Woesearchaeota archaeon]|nr:hypothetical protein [Candidatus Woesearchaeota archaeon]